ncbi:MAG: hypothetical protein UU77_C0069G0004 [candidate division WWE3 bacterium GW2011_GWC1_41_7]|uniref:DUF4430 domain-containing protein n=1 Tax=candidate division WWE3 bacterium GW2011_GWC1_41_7 TaxID=1619119 RepID=A0A0G1A052_UNCKA|nr:MAG: hypothetical protein UU77_C0069G0004 [candidate division WWE3 bacterium GW2011_GWC1_41_7]
MGNNLKLKKYLIVAYIILLVGGYFYINSILDVNKVSVDQKEEPKRVLEVKPVKVKLTIELTGGSKEYSVELQNIDTVLDLLEEVREDQGFIYEKTAYTYGTIIDGIEGIKAPEGYMWRIFENNIDITENVSNESLNDGFFYSIKLVKTT